MAASREDVHLPIRHRAGDLQPDVEGTEAVVHAPDCQQLGLELVQLGAEILARHFALTLPEQLDRGGIDAGLVTLLEGFLGQQRRVVQDGLQQLTQLLAAWTATLVVAADHLYAVHRRGRAYETHPPTGSGHSPPEQARPT